MKKQAGARLCETEASLQAASPLAGSNNNHYDVFNEPPENSTPQGPMGGGEQLFVIVQAHLLYERLSQKKG